MGKRKSKTVGIYCIENILSNKKYIGGSTNIYERFLTHQSLLRGNYHFSESLQKDYNNSQEDIFLYYILEECNKELLDNKEIFYIKHFNSNNPLYGYNTVEGGSGKNPNSESREKRSIAAMNNQYAKGYHHTEKTKLLLSELAKGNSHSKGMIFSEETKESLRVINQGDKKVKSTSKYVGVCWRKGREKWRAYIKINQKNYELGLYDLEEDAARAYNKKAKELYGENAKLNIIID